MDIDQIVKTCIIITILYVLTLILSVHRNSFKDSYSYNTQRIEASYSKPYYLHPMSDAYETNCDYQPKPCPNNDNVSCDCRRLCNDSQARRIVIKDDDHPLKTQFHLINGVYCYIPVMTDSCHKEYGIWDFSSGVWKCLALYPGIFDTDGKQLVGRYVYSDIAGTITPTDNTEVDYNDPKTYSVDCSNLKDEDGLPLVKIQLSSLFTFCLRNYCFSSNQVDSSQVYYSDGNCICYDVTKTENEFKGNITSPCVHIDNADNQVDIQVDNKKNRFTFKIRCFDSNTFVKDLHDYLVECDKQSETDRKIGYYKSLPYTLDIVKI